MCVCRAQTLEKDAEHTATKVDHDFAMRARCAINFNNLIRRADCQPIHHFEHL
jgi:hypothetical protein